MVWHYAIALWNDDENTAHIIIMQLTHVTTTPTSLHLHLHLPLVSVTSTHMHIFISIHVCSTMSHSHVCARDGVMCLWCSFTVTARENHEWRHCTIHMCITRTQCIMCAYNMYDMLTHAHIMYIYIDRILLTCTMHRGVDRARRI